MSCKTLINPIKDFSSPPLNWTHHLPLHHYHPKPNPHHPNSIPTYYSIDC